MSIPVTALPPGRSGSFIARWRRPRTGWVGGVLLVLGGLAAVWWWNPWSKPPANNPEGGAEPWRLAQAALAANDVTTAKQELEKCAKAWPTSAETHFLLAQTCRRLDDMEGWRMHLHRAVLLHWSPRKIQIEQQLMIAQSGGLASVEESLLDQVNHFPPEEELILEALARGYIYNDRLADAVGLADLWAKHHPQNWLPWYYRGLANRAKHFNNKAEADFERVLELNPDQLDSQLTLAILYQGEGRYADATPLLEKYLSHRAGDSDALYALATCQNAQGQTSAAAATLQQLLAKNKNHAAGLLLQGKIRLAEGKLDDALVSLRQAHALKPNSLEVLQNLALVLAQLHRTAEAAPYQKRAAKLQEVSQQLGKLERMIQQSPDAVDLRYQAAMLCLKTGWEEESAHWFQTILYIDPNHRPTHRALADYYASHGDPRRAAYHRRRAGDKGQEPRTPTRSGTP